MKSSDTDLLNIRDSILGELNKNIVPVYSLIIDFDRVFAFR